MTDHLPASRDDWPADPFELLGIPRDIDARDARRAYTRLARRFKPEHNPLEFQLIRAAYDAVLACIGDESSVPFAGITQPDFVGSRAVGHSQSAPTSDLASDFDRHWSGVCSDEDATDSYQALCQLVEERTEDTAGAYVRLHWALAISPELDETRQPIDWLVTCLLYTSPSPRDRTRSRMPSSA